MTDLSDRVKPDVSATDTGEAAPKRAGALAFLRRLGIILAIAAAASLGVALALGAFTAQGISNAFFGAAAVLFFLAVLPVFSEFGSTLRLAGRAAAEQKNLRSLLDGERETRNRGTGHTFLYGLAGILMFLLSLLTSSASQ